jgi:flagellar export protein FliJ
LSRLLDSLHKLLRVKQHNIEQLRQQIALLNNQIELRLHAIEKNISYINTERLIASVNINGADTLEAFVGQKLAENKRYAQENEELKETVNKIQEQLFEAYTEQKQFEKVQEHEQTRINTDLQSKENQEMDEMATQMHLSNLNKI